MRKVKNSIKKMMTLCLAAIMTLAMATTAFAADRIKTGNLTVNVNEGNTLKGQTIKVYKLFDLSVAIHIMLIQSMRTIKMQSQQL